MSKSATTVRSCLTPACWTAPGWEPATPFTKAPSWAPPRRTSSSRGRILVIGNDNTIREKAIVNRATYPDGVTSIGDGNFLLEGVHVAHDTKIGNKCILGNGAKTAGECVIDDKAILGSGVILKHGCHIGSWTLLRDGCRANKDVPPFIVAAHNPNAVLLSKVGEIQENIIDDIAKAYRQIYQSGTSLENALIQIKETIPMSPEIQYIIDFIEKSDKGIIGIAQL